MNGDSMSKHEDRMLTKLQSQAQSFLGVTDPSKSTSSLQVVSIPSANLSSTSKMLPPMLKSVMDSVGGMSTNIGTPALRVKAQTGTVGGGTRGNSVKKIAGSHNIIE